MNPRTHALDLLEALRYLLRHPAVLPIFGGAGVEPAFGMAYSVSGFVLPSYPFELRRLLPRLSSGAYILKLPSRQYVNVVLTPRSAIAARADPISASRSNAFFPPAHFWISVFDRVTPARSSPGISSTPGSG